MPIFSALAAGIGALATGLGAGAAGTAGAVGAGAAGATATAGAVGGAGAAIGGATATAGAVGGAGAAIGGGAAGAGGLAAGLGAAAGLAGVGLQAYGTVQQMAAQKDAQKAQEAQEQVRASQMNFEATRQTRQAIRQGIMARSTALTNATGQGASYGSGLQGGYGQIAGSVGTNVNGIEGNRGLGNAMFALNAQEASARSRQASGQGISSLGGALFNNQDAIGRLGAYGFNNLFS